jgi:Ser/Thr protein kinase RdoA (MazF antagonist)
MEKRIKERYDDAILHEAMHRYDIARAQIQLLDGFESFIYEFQRGQQAYILRVGHSLRRSVPLIQGEVDWINYLAKGGASVARAILSENGELVELIDDGNGGHFLATAFVKAEGKPPGEAEWNPGLFETYGVLLGRMHALTRAYEPPDPAWKRPHWDGADMLEVERLLPASEAAVLERFHVLMDHLRALPRDEESYGLIHQDAHAGNLFVDEAGNVTLFDFDDCAYSWFVNDVAIVLFYAVMWAEDEPGFTRDFLVHFLRGYRRENRIEARWLKEIPHFLKLREIDLYAVIHRSFDVGNLDDPWVARYMHNRRRRIEDGVPYIGFDFESLAGCL